MDLEKQDDKNRLYDLHKHNLVYISDYIKFADGKAGVALGIAFIMIGFFGNEAKKNGFTCLTFPEAGLFVGLLPLILACYFFIWKVLWPRYKKDPNLYMSWSGIGSFSNSQDYVKKIEEASDEELLLEMAHQNYNLAQVCLQKYKYSRYGFIAFTIGAIIESVCWFLS